VAAVTSGQQSAIDQAVYEAFAREGYVKQNGDRDVTKMCARIFEIVAAEKILGKREREEKATKRGDLVAQVFPQLAGPDKFDELEESARPLAEAVYKRIAADVWAETRSAAEGRVQRMVGVNMGNGYVLCRTKVGKDRVDAVYITDVLECIRLDFTRPDNASLDRRVQTSTRNREMLVLRQPHNAKAYASEYDKTLRNALTEAHNQMALTVEAVSVNGDHGDEDEEGDEG
jgi:hypothetical protein